MTGESLSALTCPNLVLSKQKHIEQVAINNPLYGRTGIINLYRRARQGGLLVYPTQPIFNKILTE